MSSLAHAAGTIEVYTHLTTGDRWTRGMRLGGCIPAPAPAHRVTNFFFGYHGFFGWHGIAELLPSGRLAFYPSWHVGDHHIGCAPGEVDFLYYCDAEGTKVD